MNNFKNKNSIFFAFLILTIASLSFIGCSSDVTDSNSAAHDGAWLIPEDQVFDGGPGRDGIPSLFEPQFQAASQVTFLSSTDLVVGIRVGDTVRGYPHIVLDWHEIANDQIAQSFYAVTYCPLTGSAIGWNRKIDGSVTTFGVSGLLYNTNLLPYDRETASNWSQMEMKCVNGVRSGKTPETFQVIETTWESFQQMFPDSKIITPATGFSRSYGTYPYGDYRTNHGWVIFPIGNDDRRLNRKVRVLGFVVGGQSKAYPISVFTENTTIIEELFGGEKIVSVGNSSRNFAAIFKRTATDGTVLSFEAVTGNGTAVMSDAEGTNYDIFGFGLDGPRKGQRLEAISESYIAYWFAWAAFHPDTEIYQTQSVDPGV